MITIMISVRKEILSEELVLVFAIACNYQIMNNETF